MVNLKSIAKKIGEKTYTAVDRTSKSISMITEVGGKAIKKRPNKKMKSKRITKKSKATLHISNREVPSILGDQNRFFKDEVEEAERALFFT